MTAPIDTSIEVIKEGVVSERKQRLAKCEERIRAGLNGFMDAAEAIKEVQIDQLYLDDHETFDDYCKKIWGHTRKWAYDLIRAFNAVEGLEVLGDKLPITAALQLGKTENPVERAVIIYHLQAIVGDNGVITKPMVKVAQEALETKRVTGLTANVEGESMPWTAELTEELKEINQRRLDHIRNTLKGPVFKEKGNILDLINKLRHLALSGPSYTVIVYETKAGENGGQ